MIPHSRPLLGEPEAAAAARVIRTGQVAQGPEVEALEAELSDRLGVRHVVAVNSGTAALHLSLLGLGIGAGDEVAIPTYVCAALLHAVQHAGAHPLLVDADPRTFSLSVPDLMSRKTARLRAVILPHLFGHAADLESALEAGVPVVEDCAMSLGASRGPRTLGSFGSVSAFSFYATKMICSGEGGAVATNDDGLAAGVRDLRDYDGRDDARARFNFKLTDVQAAIARVQLGRLDEFISRRRHLAQRYAQRLASSGAQLPRFGEGDVPFRFVVRHPFGADDLIPRFEAEGVVARRPVHRPLHVLRGEDEGAYPEADRLHASAISLPLYPALSDSEADRILQVSGEIL